MSASDGNYLGQYDKTKMRVNNNRMIGEGWGHLNALLSEAVRYDGMTGRAVRRMLRRRTHDGYVDIKPTALSGIPFLS